MNTTEAIAALDHISRQATTNFGNLSYNALNKKPSADKWSIAQCLDHLIVSNRTYYPQFEEVIQGKHANSFYQNIRFLSRSMGSWLIKKTGADRSGKMKNPAAFTPAQGNIPATIVNDFLLHQEEMKSYYLKMQHIDLHNTVLSSPASGIITYSLFDLLDILCGHEQRHINQALEVLHNQS